MHTVDTTTATAVSGLIWNCSATVGPTLLFDTPEA